MSISNTNFPAVNFPAVVACGYRRVLIPKSGNLFPVFLIALPVTVNEEESSNNDNNYNRRQYHHQQRQRQQQQQTENDDCLKRKKKRTIRFVWRSKRDFMILARTRCSATNSNRSLPKAALKKIVQDNVVPWRRLNTLYLLSLEEEENNDDDDNKVPYFLKSEYQLPNRYCPRMKKSLWQIDRFLQMIYTENTTRTTSTISIESTKQRETKKMKLAWEIFCRPYDTDGLITPKEFDLSSLLSSQSSSITTEEKNGPDINTIKNKGLAECETNNDNSDSDSNSNSDSSRVSSTNNDISNPTKTIMTTKTSLEESSRFGQYFASRENSQKVVECVLEKILPLYYQYSNRRQNQMRDNGDINNNNNVRLLFVEPSCGNGDIVIALIEALRQKEISPGSVLIQGYDIDPNVITTCRERQKLLVLSNNNGGGGTSSDEIHYEIHWECRNFFETTRQRCIGNFDVAVNNNIILDNDNDEQYRTDEEMNNKRNNHTNDNHETSFLVCCLGGPPYTNGPGNGSKIQRDLPTQFLRHCQEEWKADVITFILPTRYREGMQHNISDCTFTTPNTAATATATANITTMTNSAKPVGVETTTTTTSLTQDYCGHNNWICETEELNKSTFFFRGTIQITQPSIIQNFYKEKEK